MRAEVTPRKANFTTSQIGMRPAPLGFSNVLYGLFKVCRPWVHLGVDELDDVLLALQLAQQLDLVRKALRCLAVVARQPDALERVDLAVR